jgi:hypothetical protein
MEFYNATNDPNRDPVWNKFYHNDSVKDDNDSDCSQDKNNNFMVIQHFNNSQFTNKVVEYS